MSIRTLSRRMIAARRAAERRLDAQIEDIIVQLSKYMSPSELSALLERIASDVAARTEA